MLVTKIISGGQTGAVRGALDAAITLGIEYGGWCPAERRAEDGTVPAQYQLTQLPVGGERERTRKNVEDSDGTLIIARGKLQGGTDETARHADRIDKPWLLLDLDEVERNPGSCSGQLKDWILRHHVRSLNVAGPRESEQPGIQLAVARFLEFAFLRLHTIEEVVDQLLAELPEDSRARLGQLEEHDLIDTHFGLGLFVRNAYLLHDDELMRAIGRRYLPFYPADELSGEIVRRAWQRLRSGS